MAPRRLPRTLAELETHDRDEASKARFNEIAKFVGEHTAIHAALLQRLDKIDAILEKVITLDDPDDRKEVKRMVKWWVIRRAEGEDRSALLTGWRGWLAWGFGAALFVIAVLTFFGIGPRVPHP